MRHSHEVTVEVSVIKVASPFGRVGVKVLKLKLLCLCAKTMLDIGRQARLF